MSSFGREQLLKTEGIFLFGSVTGHWSLTVAACWRLKIDVQVDGPASSQKTRGKKPGVLKPVMAKEVRQRTEQAVREGGGELKLAGKGVQLADAGHRYFPARDEAVVHLVLRGTRLEARSLSSTLQSEREAPCKCFLSSLGLLRR